MFQAVQRLTLKNILWLALALRVTAAIFSQGYGWYDDHFRVIEVAQSWVDGKNMGDFLPDPSRGITEPREISLFYPGVHFVLFKLMADLNISDPQLKMLLIRLLHAFYSLFVVYFGYQITKKISNERYALCVGLLLAVLWFMPNLSIRNLQEMVCIPPLLVGCWYLIRNESDNWRDLFIAGFVSAFAFSIRYQTALFIGGMGITLLLQRKWGGAVVFAIGSALNVLLFQCLTDIILWGYPLAQFLAYVKFNMVHKGDFITGYWFNYLLLIGGLLIPPFSLMLWFGYFKTARKHLMLFLPSFLFLAFHCYFENKQERFILPFIPFFIILGTIGWYDFKPTSQYWSRHTRLLKNIMLFVVIVNCILLGVFTVSSTKTSRMDSLSYLRDRKDVKAFVVEATDQGNWEQFPLFYLGQQREEYILKSDYSAAQLKSDLQHEKQQPNYVIFLSNRDIDARILKFKAGFSNIEYLATIKPSFIDRLFYWLNPVNRNTECYIYKIV